MREIEANKGWPEGSPEGTGEAPSGERKPLTAAESAYARELFERHRLALYRYLKGVLQSREDASELLQETYLRLLRQPAFEHVQKNASAYLFQIATNLVRDRFRQRMRNGTLALSQSLPEPMPESVDLASWPDLALQGEQLANIVVAALEELDSDVRVAVLLHRFRDLTHRQIATLMGVSERTIERYIKEGLLRIAARLEKEL
jgi:RNA polymerase sigma factor (sigma-70 family)